MRIQSLVIDTSQIELSLGSDDGGREYLFARLPFDDEACSHQSLHDLRLASLDRVREAVDTAITHLQEVAGSNG